MKSSDSVAEELVASQAAADSRANSSEIHRADVAKRLVGLPVNAGNANRRLPTVSKRNKHG